MNKTFSPLFNLLSRNGFYKLFPANFYQCITSPLKKEKKKEKKKSRPWVFENHAFV